MTRRQTIPRQWLIGDQRIGDDLWRAVRALPRGSGVRFARASCGACAIWRVSGS